MAQARATCWRNLVRFGVVVSSRTKVTPCRRLQTATFMAWAPTDLATGS